MNNEIYKEIIDEFAKKLAERHFLGKEYIVYVFSIIPPKKLDNYSLNLESSAHTMKFDVSKGFPIPRRIDSKLMISFKNYQKYAYNRGGDICSFKSIVQDHKDNGGKPFLDKAYLEHWEQKHVYYCGYEFKEIPLIIFLIFDFETVDSSDELAERELNYLNIDPVISHVEDMHHKQYIFNVNYLSLLRQEVDPKDFSLIHQWLDKLSLDYKYTHYLQKIYYDFFIANLLMYEVQFEQSHQEKLMSLAKEFEKKQKNLFIIPFYRDHFLHQLNVYLLGITIINILERRFKNNIVDDFNRSYYPVESQKYQYKHDACAIWFLASMFHDISYPVEKSGQWLDAFTHNYLYTPRYGLPYLKASIDILNVIPDIDYSNCIDDLAEYHRKLLFKKDADVKIDYEGIAAQTNVQKGCEIRNEILSQVIKYRDHGILSATMLLHRFWEEKDVHRFLFPAAAAISLHNFLWTDIDILIKPCSKCVEKECENCSKWKKVYDDFFKKWEKRGQNNLTRDDIKNLRHISYESDPVSFLLIICDLLHDWGRHNFEDLGQAFDLYFNPCQLVGIDCDHKKITFSIKIETPYDPDTAEMIEDYWLYKKQEIVKIFSRLRFIENHDIVIRLFSQTKRSIEFSMKYFG